MTEGILKKLGLTDKEIGVYLTCLQLGRSSVRKIAQEAGINRGTTYDILKSLRELGLVSYYHKSKRQYFIAENPNKLKHTVESKIQDLTQTGREIESIIPELTSIYDKSGDKPTVKYYEGESGIKTILTDVLDVCAANGKFYYVYSSSTIKKFLFEAYKNFSKDRIKAGVSVNTISIGPGGETVGLDQRKWLTKDESSPTYTLIYQDKIAMISLDGDNRPIGVIVEDKNIYQTQKTLFEFIWSKL